jgi:signal peptidase II
MSKPKPAKLARLFSIWRQKAARNPLFWPALAITATVLLVDQVTKNWVLANPSLGGQLCSPRTPAFCGKIEISAIFDLTMVWNKGVSFGLLAGGMTSRVLLSTVSILVSVGLLIWLANLRRRVAAIGIGFIIGGALGNAWDRIIYGAVVDFFDFSGLYFPYVFNVADVAINVGVACLAWDAFFGEGAKLERSRKANKAKKTA